MEKKYEIKKRTRSVIKGKGHRFTIVPNYVGNLVGNPYMVNLRIIECLQFNGFLARRNICWVVSHGSRFVLDNSIYKKQNLHLQGNANSCFHLRLDLDNSVYKLLNFKLENNSASNLLFACFLVLLLLFSLLSSTMAVAQDGSDTQTTWNSINAIVGPGGITVSALLIMALKWVNEQRKEAQKKISDKDVKIESLREDREGSRIDQARLESENQFLKSSILSLNKSIENKDREIHELRSRLNSRQSSPD